MTSAHFEIAGIVPYAQFSLIVFRRYSAAFLLRLRSSLLGVVFHESFASAAFISACANGGSSSSFRVPVQFMRISEIAAAYVPLVSFFTSSKISSFEPP